MRGISSLTGKSGVTKVIGGITMSRVTELEKALTTLFRKGTEVGYTETEIDEFLENIDYHALLQAVWNKAETVYAYRADGKNALSLGQMRNALVISRFAENDLPLPGVPKIRPFGFFSSFRSTMMRLLERALMP